MDNNHLLCPHDGEWSVSPHFNFSTNAKVMRCFKCDSRWLVYSDGRCVHESQWDDVPAMQWMEEMVKEACDAV